MADNWQVLDFTYLKGKVSFDSRSRRLVAEEDESGKCQSYSLRDVNIVFLGINIRMSASVMQHFAQNDTVVVFCDWKGTPASGVYPWIDAHGRVAARQRAQAALSLPRSKNAWMRIVKAKIAGQANTLDACGRECGSDLRSLARQVRTGDSSNKEAQAARLYWSSLFPDEGFLRNSGVRAGGRNSLLDYGYTILRGHSMRAVLSAGLTPALGMCHKARGNAFALADDLIEPFRPVVDFAVAKQAMDADVANRDVRRELIAATLVQFAEDGRTVPAVMTDFAQSYGRYVEGDLAMLEVPVWNPR